MPEFLIASRFVHFGAVMILFGSSLFPIYAVGQSATVAAESAAEALDWWLRRLLTAAAVISLISAISWLLAQAGDIGDGFDPAVVKAVLFETGFGRVWQLRLVIASLLLLLLLAWPLMSTHPRRRLALVATVSGFLLASQAWVGHAAAVPGVAGDLRVTNQLFHLGAAAVWLGGLLPLSLVLSRARSDDPGGVWQTLALAALRRFSSVGIIAVALLMVTGLVSSWSLVGSVDALAGTLYGRLLVFKVAMFLLMVGLAVVNRLYLLPRALAHRAVAGSLKQQFMALRRNVLMEQILGLLALAAVSVFATLPPAIHGGDA